MTSFHRQFTVILTQLGKVIGQGAFGRVIKAEATGIIAGEEVTTVAVKMLKGNILIK